MQEALRFFIDYEILIYLIIGAFGIWQVRKFTIAWGELREAAFGLERESAQIRLNRAATLLVFILMTAVVEFAFVTFIVPSVPGATALFTPTVDLLATPTTTLSPSTLVEPGGTTATPVPTVQAVSSGCTPNEIDISSPVDGETIRDVVEIIGSADIANFGFYKYEMARPGDTNWQPIQAGSEPVRDARLGYWDTSRIVIGEYFLRLIVTDNVGAALEPCAIRVYVAEPSEK